MSPLAMGLSQTEPINDKVCSAPQASRLGSVLDLRCSTSMNQVEANVEVEGVSNTCRLEVSSSADNRHGIYPMTFYGYQRR
jgi:hypothetical protein